MSAISHFALLGLKPEKSENLSKAFITPITESLSFTKNVALSAEPPLILTPLIFLFSIICKGTTI